MLRAPAIALATVTALLEPACSGEIVATGAADAAPPSTTGSVGPSSGTGSSGGSTRSPESSNSSGSSSSSTSSGGSSSGGGSSGAGSSAEASTPAPELDASGFGTPYPCQETDAGLACTCPSPWPGDPITSGGAFDPLTKTSYATLQAFDALAVGRWQRIRGSQQMHCEQVGVEFTADHHVVPLVVGPDGNVDALVTGEHGPFQLSFQGGPDLIFNDPGYGLTTSAPQFYDAGGGPGTGMTFDLNPWVSDYVKMP